MPEQVLNPKLRAEITKTLLRLTGHAVPGNGLTGSEPAEDRRQGATYGTYQILKRLGTGGMGEVYMALDTRLDRHVAIKFLPPALTSDEEILSRFQQEARTTSALNHPNIVTIFEVGQSDREHYIVSEYIQGVTLRTALKYEILDLAVSLDLAMQVTSALIAAHSAGVIHRDVKPANIMIRDDGYVKVIDFGLAKLKPTTPFRKSPSTSRRDRPTRPGSMLGTVDYMSPEQARGEEVDERADIWSLGVVLYEMVTKRRPFSGTTESHLVVEILDKPIPPCGADVPQVIANILTRALQKDRNKRYQTADHLYGDLKEARRVLGFSSELAPTALPLRKLNWRRVAWRWWVIVGAVVLVAATLWLGFGRHLAIQRP
ncbi:MAG TPA: serine/threonine-protein kinase [Bryobacteraceae bacterium]|nr:serine/threonine-protein kinase [Bryobacteraceae bacterium]